MGEPAVATLWPFPDHPACLETEMGHTVGKITLERAQHQWGPPVAGQRHQFVEMGGFCTGRDLGV